MTDLDARVAALLVRADTYARWQTTGTKEALRLAIRAELQKSATLKTSDEIGFMSWETAQPAAPVELPVVAWFYECADGTTLARTKDDKPVDDGEPLVKLSDAQAAIAAAQKGKS